MRIDLLLFVQTEEFADEVEAEIGDKPENNEVKIDEIKIENIKWKHAQRN